MNKTYKGFLGENLAIIYLLKNQYKIIVRNYRKKWGEIDIVAYDKKTKETVFIEVKMIIDSGASRILPEEELTEEKIKRLKRVILSFLSQYRLEDKPWRFDFFAIEINRGCLKHSIRHYKDVYLECC
ncbi:MAG: YraN family protein [Candidatus Paceibacterota bacterium]|jgi:putative endonuclease